MRFSSTLFVVATLAAPGFLRAADVAVVDEIIAKVNGEIITRNDFEKGRRQLEGSLRQQNLTGVRLEEALKQGEKNILRERIDSLLLLTKGKELAVNVDPEVNKQLTDIQNRSKIADPDKFRDFVRQETGQSYEDYKAEMKNQVLTNRIIRQEVASRIQFKRDDQMKYYDEHKSEFQRQERVFLREMLIASQAGKNADADKKAKDLSSRAKKGEKFEELAQNNSDSQSAPEGGEIGAFEKGQLRPELEKAVWDQPRGFVTDPITVSNGFLILKVEEHQKAGLAEFDEVQADISNKLFQPRFQPELRKYLTDLRTKAFLEIKPGWEDSAPAPGKDTTWQDPAEIVPLTVPKEQVLMKTRRRRLMGVVPIPGTTVQNTGVSSSR